MLLSPYTSFVDRGSEGKFLAVSAIREQLMEKGVLVDIKLPCND